MRAGVNTSGRYHFMRFKPFKSGSDVDCLLEFQESHDDPVLVGYF